MSDMWPIARAILRDKPDEPFVDAQVLTLIHRWYLPTPSRPNEIDLFSLNGPTNSPTVLRIHRACNCPQSSSSPHHIPRFSPLSEANIRRGALTRNEVRCTRDQGFIAGMLHFSYSDLLIVRQKISAKRLVHTRKHLLSPAGSNSTTIQSRTKHTAHVSQGSPAVISLLSVHDSSSATGMRFFVIPSLPRVAMSLKQSVTY
jgi:hypothetical protein